MTDERVDALVRRLDVPWDPDPAFVELALVSLTPHLQRARKRDQRPFARFMNRVIRPATTGGRDRTGRTTVRTTVLVVVLLVIALFAAIIAGAVWRRPTFGNGPLVVSHAGELVSVDADSMDVRTTLRADGPIAGLARSPDGRFVTFWTGASPERHFEVANVDGTGRRDLAAGLNIARGGCTDDWSHDSTRVATEVTVDGGSRILVADVASGQTRFVTPSDEIAHCPLWSPDGRSIAFQRDRVGLPSVLAVIAPDGSGLRDVSGDLHGLTDYGANGWSPDGQFVYFGAGAGGIASVFRSNIRTATSDQLTADGVSAYAPSVSPDGKLVSFIIPKNGSWEIHVMRADGSDEHPLLEFATNSGWSPDGRYIVAVWYGTSPDAQDGGVMLVTPEGHERRVVLPFNGDCAPNPSRPHPRCIDGVSWGQPIP